MADSATPSGIASEFGPSEMPVSEAGEATPAPGTSFPPYPPYTTATEPAPSSVAETIVAGRDLRVQHKTTPRRPVRPPPKPAKPRGPKATDVKTSRRAARAQARCLRRHGAVLTDRLERISKPRRRTIIYLWREHAHCLPPETIARLRSMLDADEPFKPDQAYEYFVNLRKMKKKAKTMRSNEIKKDVLAVCSDKRFVWARNATVAFAKGIQQKLSRPGRYVLTDRMLRLSNIILDEMCSHVMHMKTPSRCCNRPKSRFMIEMSDKVAVWIDEILAESDDRMLMMDFDEDDEVEQSNTDALRPEPGAEGSATGNQSETPTSLAETPTVTPAETPAQSAAVTPDLIEGEDDVTAGDAGFTDDFLNMMGGGGLQKGPQPAYLKFTGEMLEAFMILTDSMYKKGDGRLVSHGKFSQTYTQGADELKQATDFEATEYNTTLASQLNKDLNETVKPNTPSKLAPYMKEIVDICSNYLAQYAEYNKDKGPAFKLLVKAMRTKPNELLYQKDKIKKTYGEAATDLEKAKGLESDQDEPNLSQKIHSSLSKLVDGQTPADLKTDMAETLDLSSKYLSQRAIDEIERGPAFNILIKELEREGAESFTPEFQPLENNFAAAYTLKSAPGLTVTNADPMTAPIFKTALHKAVDPATPANLKKDMNEKALQLLLNMMKNNSSKELAKRNNYAMNYGIGALEIETAPSLVPFLPVKDIADEAKGHLLRDVESSTPTELKTAMKTLVQDVGRYLSQSIALRSGVAGDRYPLNFLAAIKKSLGTRPLFKYKSYGQTYVDAADVLKYAGPLESDPKAEELQYEISIEMKRGVPSRIAPTVVDGLSSTMDDAAKHLAKVGTEKGEALNYLVKVMKEEGDIPLGLLQGYQQTYNDGARRIENSSSLGNDKVDKGAYEAVRGKLTNLTEKKPSPQHAKYLPDDVEKRRVLADLMARKGDEILGEEGIYKLTYKEGGDEIIKAPIGVITAHDQEKSKQMLEKLNGVIPDKKLQDALKGLVDSHSAQEGAAHLTDIIKRRGEAMQVIHDEMMKKKDQDFLTIGKFQKNHSQTADMMSSATHFGGQHPSPVLLDKVIDRVDSLHAVEVSNLAKAQMDDASSITSLYIAGVANKECGLDAKALAALDGKDFGAATCGGSDGMRGGSDDTRGGNQSARGGAAVGGRSSPDLTKAVTQNLDDEEARRRREEERRRLAEEALRHREHFSPKPKYKMEIDPEREAAMKILHEQLKSKGGEVFYKQPHTTLSHAQASDWLSKSPMKVDKTVKESGDTARLHKKFERKLSALVSKHTPTHMYDSMQDVVIESSRMLSEYFVSSNYKTLVREALISEMQKRCNEILIEVDGAAETYFFAAQRLKKTKILEAKEPCNQVAYYLTKKLDDMIRCRSMARKLTATMKDHIKDAADYLSELVTKPDDKIEAYVSLLGEMEAAGDALLIEGNIPKSYKDAASYLRQLTSFEDQINRSNSSLQSSTEAKLKGIMANVTARGYSQSVLAGVITESTRLLVSYIMLQGEKTEALKILVEQMEIAGENVLLRHGTIRKSYTEGAAMLQGKNCDQLGVSNTDPVVSRKIQIKLNNLMFTYTPDKYLSLIDDVIEDATLYLAVHFLQPQKIQVCKCMKNVFVQCELWCDEILRRVARPCCTCSRHVSAQALADLAPAQRLLISPGSTNIFAPGLEVSLSQCPSKLNKTCRHGDKTYLCPASKPTSGCDQVATTSYLLYSTAYNQSTPHESSPTRILPPSQYDSLQRQKSPDTNLKSHSPLQTIFFSDLPSNAQNPQTNRQEVSDDSSPTSYYTPLTTNTSDSSRDTKSVNPFWQSPTTMFAKVHTQDNNVQPQPPPTPALQITNREDRRISQAKPAFYSRTPIISTDQMADWHAMMVSLMWNVQAWREWIQENIDRALAYQHNPNISPADAEENWASFQRRVATEALQWRQYNTFSRQLTLRLAQRYKDKRIVSPTRATVKTETYIECQKEMLEIINMFNKWTHWLTVVVKETDSLLQMPGTDIPIHEYRLNYLKKKIEEYSEDWNKYNMHLKICWEHKYRTIISDWLPSWSKPGPVWVVSACGAVPSGAVAAGVFEGEVTWVARTTHRCNVLPAALHPSKHSCMVYADGAVHHYTKYQVMCNAEVRWLAWRAGEVGARAVRVAGGVHVGRVHYRGSHLLGAVHAPAYRCHVVIFGRSFAFNCYELLVLTSGDDRL
ncbi:uncharacterized protein ACR2FA_011155 [Aphomia sociella]